MFFLPASWHFDPFSLHIIYGTSQYPPHGEGDPALLFLERGYSRLLNPAQLGPSYELTIIPAPAPDYYWMAVRVQPFVMEIVVSFLPTGYLSAIALLLH